MKELFTLDIGNSRPTVGHFANGELKEVFSLGHFEESILPSLQEIPYTISLVGRAPLFLTEIGNHKIDLRSKWQGPQFFGMPITYAKTLGDDRLFTSAYAWHELSKKQKKTALILDLGTFMTFDWISHDGGHLGGVIAPGLATYLHNFARGELLQVHSPEEINWSAATGLPQNTQSAITTSAKWYLESMLEKVLEQSPTPEIIYLTGGSTDVAKNILERMALNAELCITQGLVHQAMHKLASMIDN